VFVTSSRYSGDLKTAGAGATGLAGGDALCQTAATAANLGGTWKAWLSIGVAGGGATTNAVDRIAEGGPWYRLDGEKAFNNRANLMTAPLVSLNHDENNRLVLEDREVWTGTEVGGRWTGQDCTQWTSGNGIPSGTMGDASKADGSWTTSAPASCAFGKRLYCLEQ
jgi:hypothetical protein